MLDANSPKWTDLVQTVCAIGGLVGLVVYIVPTVGIFKETLRQNEASRRPLFDFEFVHNTTTGTILRAVNVGSGPALNFRAFRGDGERIFFPSTEPIVVVGDDAVLARGVRFQVEYDFTRFHGVRIEYTDLAGKRYWSTFSETPRVGNKRREEQYGYEHGTFPAESMLSRLERWSRSLDE